MPAPRHSPLSRSEVMARVRSRDTRPELRVKALLSEAGVVFARDVADLSGRPDFVVTPTKRRQPPLAVFVHGCWWHGHSCPRGARVPKTNRPYWLAKVARNRRRDRRVARELRALGYSVWVVWECRLREGSLPARLAGRLAAYRTRKRPARGR